MTPEQEEQLLKILEYVVVDEFGNVHINTNAVVHGDVIFDS